MTWNLSEDNSICLSWNFCHVKELLQQTRSKMSGTESTDSAAFDVEAERVECPLKTPTSTPENVSIF